MPPNPSNETWLSIPTDGDWESPILRNLKPYLEGKSLVPALLVWQKTGNNPSACVCLCISLACWQLQAVSFLGASSKKVDWQEHQPMLEMTSDITRPWKYGSFFHMFTYCFLHPWVVISGSIHSILCPKCSISTSAAHSNILFFTKTSWKTWRVWKIWELNQTFFGSHSMLN